MKSVSLQLPACYLLFLLVSALLQVGAAFVMQRVPQIMAPKTLLSSLSWSSSTALPCQLLGMNCAEPTDFTFSFQGFCKRGGETDIHKDGWGLAYYQDGGLQQFHGTEAASSSPLADYFGKNPIQTLNMMGHIRYATVGQVDLTNVHPFSREMWGIQWSFCHNGEVPMFTENPKRRLKVLGPSNSQYKEEEAYYHPIGTTDSEATFCAVLNALRVRFQTLPSLPVLSEALQELCQEIVEHDPEATIFNFLLSYGPHTLWAYSWPGSRPGSKVWNGLYYAVREYPFSEVVQLCDVDYSVNFRQLTGKGDRVSVIATKPLTKDEEWKELSRGQLILFDQGKPHMSITELFQVELLGHGLHSTVLEPSNLLADMKSYNLQPTQFMGGAGI
jgi:predicted glutamine amidotransferase